MAEILVGGVELKRISELLAKVLIESDLSDYNVAIDKAGEADTKKVPLDQLLLFAGGGGRIFTAPSEVISGTVTSNNLSFYMRLNSPVDKLISTFRVFILTSTTTNLVSVKLYNSNGSEIVGAEGSGSPTIDSTPQNLDIPLTIPTILNEGVFYWVGLHQAVGAGANFGRINSHASTEWMKTEAGSALASSVPSGSASSIKPTIELM